MVYGIIFVWGFLLLLVVHGAVHPIFSTLASIILFTFGVSAIAVIQNDKDIGVLLKSALSAFWGSFAYGAFMSGRDNFSFFTYFAVVLVLAVVVTAAGEHEEKIAVFMR